MPMSDLEILKELIREEALVTLEDGLYGKRKVTLIEPKNPCHSEYTVDINNIPTNAIVIKTDTFPAPKPIFKGSKGEYKRADFVIIAETIIKNKPNNLIIFIELKKGKGNSEASIIQQLKGAQCIIAYCRSIGQVFWQQPDFLNPDKYEYRFVSIRNIEINKKVSFEKPKQGLHDSPAQMLKITLTNHLEFKQLVGKVTR